jgi:hypothetical protein
MKSIAPILSIVLLSCLLAACSTPEKVVQEAPPEKPAEPIVKELPTTTQVYKYNERYYVKGASIAEDTDFDDPLQAIRVIQIKESRNEVLVISAFDQAKIAGKDVGMESWLAIEMPSFEPGRYDISKAIALKFYRFELGDISKRYDGAGYTGSLEIKKVTEEKITGFLNIMIKGTIKGFNVANNDFAMSFSGSFNIDVVPLDATQYGK